MAIAANPVDIYLFKASSRNTRKRYELYSKITIRYKSDVNDNFL